MKQKLILSLASFIAGIMCVNAQVTIGGSSDPIKGSVLDLKSGGDKGLLLPYVVLDKDDLTQLKLESGSTKESAKGMMVYNTSDNNVYVWNGDIWKQVFGGLGDNSGQGPVVLTGLTTSNGKIEKEETLKVGTPKVLSVVYIPSTASNKGLIWNSEKPNIIDVDADGKVTGLVETTSPITITATSMADPSLIVSWKITVNTVGQGVAPGENVKKETSGNYEIMGATCYDVGQGNKNGSCGETRTGNFPDEASLNRTYYFMSNDGNFSNLRVGYYEDDNGILESVTYDGTGTVKGVVAFKVIFNSDINDIAYGSSPYNVANKPKSVKIFAQFETSSSEKYVELELVVQDCSCCPSGCSTLANAYAGSSLANIQNASFQSHVMAYFTKMPKTKLCLWKSNDSSTYSWSDAKKRCANGDALLNAVTEEKTGDWRLFNISELSEYHHRDKNILTFVANYWSSTQKNSTNGFTTEYNSANNYIYIENPLLTKKAQVRCVRSIAN